MLIHSNKVKNQVKPVDVFIIGAQKAGTTSLKEYLANHPVICTHKQLEMSFFVSEDLFEEGYPAAFKRYFAHYRSGQILLAKNVGVFTNAQALQNLRNHNPQVKIILILRNPVERAQSAYWYAVQKGWENVLSFEEAVWLSPERFNDPFRQRSCDYLERGHYSKWLIEVYRLFPKENVWIYLFEDFLADPGVICKDIFIKLDLQPIAELSMTNFIHNRAALPRYSTLAKLAFLPVQLKPLKLILKRLLPETARDSIKDWISRNNKKSFHYLPIHPETRSKLIDYYIPLNRELSELLEKDLSHWNQ